VAAHLLLDNLDLSGAERDSYIIEIGSVRERSPESSIPSSLYLAQKAEAAGLNFLTVDLSKSSWELAREYVGDKAVLVDGTEFLREFDGKISVLYLDNYDYPYDEAHFQSICARSGHDFDGATCDAVRKRSPQVHFEQMLAALPKLASPCWIVVDNTDRSRPSKRLFNPFWGKGAKVVPYLVKHDFPIIKEGLGGLMLSRSEKPSPRILKGLYFYCGLGRMRRLYELFGHQAPESVT